MRVFDGSSVAVEMVSATELVASRGRREESLAPPRRGRVGGNAAVTAAAYCVRKLYSYSQPGHRQTLRSQLTDTRSNSSETDSRKRVGTRHARLTGYPPYVYMPIYLVLCVTYALWAAQSARGICLWRAPSSLSAHNKIEHEHPAVPVLCPRHMPQRRLVLLFARCSRTRGS